MEKLPMSAELWVINLTWTKLNKNFFDWRCLYGLVFKRRKKIPPCPIEDIVGEPKYYLDGRGANLYVYDKCVVIDRTQGGIFNIGNRTYKVIPLKYIIAMQIKSTGATTGFLEFSTYGHENTSMKGFDRIDDEDNINFSSEESAKAAREILEFILKKIVD